MNLLGIYKIVGKATDIFLEALEKKFFIVRTSPGEKVNMPKYHEWLTMFFEYFFLKSDEILEFRQTAFLVSIGIIEFVCQSARSLIFRSIEHIVEPAETQTKALRN